MKMILSALNLMGKIGVCITIEENGESKLTSEEIVIYLTSSCVILAFFGMSGPVFKGPRVPKAKITQERVEYNVFLFNKPLKGSKSLKIFKISLTFRFDKLSNLSKSVHTGENSQILTVSNKKYVYLIIYIH
jgi:hypothetical protein